MAARATDEERRVARRRVAAGFVAVVALSAGMVAVRSGATVAETAAVVLVGALVGAGLLVVLAG